MAIWTIIFALSIVSFVTAHHDTGTHDGDALWRKTICEINDPSMFQEMEACFQMEAKAVRDAAEDCMKEAVPSSEGSTIAFVNAACKDKSLFQKYDECFSEYEANAAFKKLMDVLPPVVACYDEIFKKYDMPPYSSYFNTST